MKLRAKKSSVLFKQLMFKHLSLVYLIQLLIVQKSTLPSKEIYRKAKTATLYWKSKQIYKIMLFVQMKTAMSMHHSLIQI